MTGRYQTGKGLVKDGAKRDSKVLHGNIQGTTELTITWLTRRGVVKQI